MKVSHYEMMLGFEVRRPSDVITYKFDAVPPLTSKRRVSERMHYYSSTVKTNKKVEISNSPSHLIAINAYLTLCIFNANGN